MYCHHYRHLVRQYVVQNTSSLLINLTTAVLFFKFLFFFFLGLINHIHAWIIFQLQKFRDELKNRSRVLKRLGHIDGDGVVQLKGRAACLIDTGDELLVTELMFNGELSINEIIKFMYVSFMAVIQFLLLLG